MSPVFLLLFVLFFILFYRLFLNRFFILFSIGIFLGSCKEIHLMKIKIIEKGVLIKKQNKEKKKEEDGSKLLKNIKISLDRKLIGYNYKDKNILLKLFKEKKFNDNENDLQRDSDSEILYMKEELIIKRIAYAYDLFSLLYKKDKKSKFIYCDIIHIHFLYSFIFLIRKQEKKIFFSFLVFLPFLGFSIPLTDAVLIEFFFDEKKNSVEKLYKYINIITSFNLKSQEDLKSLRLNKIFSFLHRIVFFINKSQDKNIETDDVYGNSLQEKINKIIKHKKVEDYSDIIIQKKILKEIISKIDVYISPRLHTKFVIFSSVFFVLLFFINKILFFIFFTPMFLFFFQKLFSYIFKYIIYYLALLFLNLKGLFFLKK